MSQVRIPQDTAADEEEREENKEGLPESVKDLNLNREGFEQDALNLPIHEFYKVLQRNDLKCQNEDQVLNLIFAYMKRPTQRIANQMSKNLMPSIKLDRLSKERLIELSKYPPHLIQGME